ncbi:MAG: SRPBCC family protein [Pseudomonadota bacterium]
MTKTAIFACALAASMALVTSAFAGAEMKTTYKTTADELWKLVEFHQPSENIMPPVKSSTLSGKGVGASKSNTLDGGGELNLQLVYIDEPSKAYNYVIRSSPLPLKNYVGEVRVTDAGDGRSTLTWRGVFEADGVDQVKADEIVQGFYDSIAGRIAEKFPKD